MRGTEGTALLAGEPGIGKTLVCSHFVERARGVGCGVAAGSCREGGGASYWPWVQILEDLVRGGSEARLRNALQGGAPGLFRLIGGFGAPEALPSLPGEYAQQRLHRQVVRFLRRIAEPADRVVFIDNLHWCGADSLAMLEAVADSVASIRVLLLLAVRGAEAPPSVTATLRG